MPIPVPEYLLLEWLRHFRRIAERAVCDSSDTKTANALRLARKDVRRMESMLGSHGKENTKKPEGTAQGAV